MSSINKVISGKEKIAIEVLLPDVYLINKDALNDSLKIGKKSGITIRNRPYDKLEIIKLENRQKQTIIPSYSGNYKAVTDITRSNVYDFFVTLTDIALKTKDGYVVGGNKIKIGNQIELEGFNYRLNGKVINIYPLLNE